MAEVNGSSAGDGKRCLHCDTLNRVSAETCIGCGSSFKTPKIVISQRPTMKPPVSVPGLLLRLAAVLIIAACVWVAVDLSRAESAEPVAAAVPTNTATPTATRPSAQATFTPLPTATTRPTRTPTPEPTATSTPLPTPTPEEPYQHLVTEGQALYNIALFYAVSVDSILAVNPGLSPERLVSGTTILVPKPTATPPLVPIEVAFGDEVIVADPAECVLHEVQEADTYSGIARQYKVPLDALLLMNRLSAETLLSPGDTVCIPTIIYSAALPGDDIAFDPGEREIIQPQILFPPLDATLPAGNNAVTLQWLAERPLAADEWYMIEVTELTDPSARPYRAFTRQTSFQIPTDWQNDSEATDWRWRVSFAWATEQRIDGELVYAYGGPVSEAHFTLEP